nr:hypothetical protein BV191_00186 [Haemophilus influenzae]PRK40650.1 hypothetical protein BV192_00122 [Haemophilus influenzae]
MKIGFHSVLIGLASFIGVQQGVIASPSSHQSISTESAEALKQQFSIALAKQDKQQITNYKFTKKTYRTFFFTSPIS